MVTTDRADLAERHPRQFRNPRNLKRRPPAPRNRPMALTEMVLLGFNYRLTDIACALGLSQLKSLETNLARRREIAAARYSGSLSEPARRACPQRAPQCESGLASVSSPDKSRAVEYGSLSRVSRAASREHRGQRALHPCAGRTRTIGTGSAAKGAGNTQSPKRPTNNSSSLPMFHGMMRPGRGRRHQRPAKKVITDVSRNELALAYSPDQYSVLVAGRVQSAAAASWKF